MSKVRLTYDYEFLERPGILHPISVGMVDIDNPDREFYAVYNDFDTREVAADWWLMKNVMSSIAHQQFVTAPFQGAPVVRDIFPIGPEVMPREKIQQGILNLCEGFDEVEFWAWYGCYDHVCLGQTWGVMTNFPDRFPYFTEDIRSLHKRKGEPPLPMQPAGKHNALDDARFNVVKFKILEGMPDDTSPGLA
jgi:hypothetical protein